MLSCSHHLLIALFFAALTSSLPAELNARSSKVPQYVLDNAPLLWLDSDEQFFPSDLSAQLRHSHPSDANAAVIASTPSPLNLENLNGLNQFGLDGKDVFLSSNEGIRAIPEWFRGVRPAADGSTPSATASVIVTVAKSDSVLDAFYFSFYAYDQGNWVFESPQLEFGDHVGDWEHTMIRFDSRTGKPQAMWYSQHASGQAFTFAALQKSPNHQTQRPYVYVAKGTHANYAMAGPHDHVLPGGFNGIVGPLIDHTSTGTLWDPTRNAYIYSYDIAADSFTAYNGIDPTGFLQYKGHWGDPQLADGEKGQINLFGQRKYVGGPTGPRDKKLSREAICPDKNVCFVRPYLRP